MQVDEWWEKMERKIVEAAVNKDAKPEQIDATSIAPWIPPSCRASTIVNTEFIKLKQTATSKEPTGCPKKLADLIRSGAYNPLDLHVLTTAKLQEICSQTGITCGTTTTKVPLLITQWSSCLIANYYNYSLNSSNCLKICTHTSFKV